MAFDEQAAAQLPGCAGESRLVVGPPDTALAMGSGDLPVLATPRLVALMEQAACAAITGRLPAGCTTVGIHVDVRHRAPSPLGATVTARAVVRDVTGPRVTFEVSAHHVVDGNDQMVGQGTHTRVVVDRAAFRVGTVTPAVP